MNLTEVEIYLVFGFAICWIVITLPLISNSSTVHSYYTCKYLCDFALMMENFQLLPNSFIPDLPTNGYLIKFAHLGNSSKLAGTHSWSDNYTSGLRKCIVSTRHHNILFMMATP